MANYLTKEEIIAGHYFIMKSLGEQAGVKDHAVLQSAVLRSRQLNSDEDEDGLFMKAAVLLHELAMNRAFHNGNKRTAYAAAKTFLLINGQSLKFDQAFAADFMDGLDKDESSIEQTARILKEHCLQKIS